MTADTLTPADAIDTAARELAITMTAVFVPFSQSRHKGDKHPSLNWKITLLRAGREILTTDYMAGSGHCPAYKATWHSTKRYEKNKAIAWECEHGRNAAVTSYGNVHGAVGAKPISPELRDVLCSLVSDADVLEAGGFEDWAGEYGYDTDSRSAEATYRACLEIALKLRAALGDDGLAKLRGATEGY